MAVPKRKITVKPDAFSTAEITVLRVFGSARLPLDGAQVVIADVPADRGSGTTNASGIFRADRAFRPGTHRVTVSKAGFGPFVSPGAVVRAGDFAQDVTFLPNSSLTGPEPLTNRITVLMRQENPKIIVTVVDGSLGNAATPIQGADVEVIGTSRGPSDAVGVFTSDPAPFGKVGVRVSVQGFFSEANDGPSFFTEVELRENGLLAAPLPDRDLRLTVTMLRNNTVRPVPFPGVSPNPIAIWASGGGTPHSVPEDPRLPSPGAGDTPQGQDGWDLGLNYVGASAFSDLSFLLGGTLQLPDRLGGQAIRPNQIRKLAIVAHGSAGVMDVNQRATILQFGDADPDPNTSLTLASLNNFTRDLDRIQASLQRNAVVLLVACRLADGKPGEDFLKAISNRWPTVKVVAIRTLGAIPATQGRKDGALLPGIRDTRFANNARNSNQPRDYEVVATASDLRAIPWISEDSPHATVALDGNIIRRGDAQT